MTVPAVRQHLTRFLLIILTAQAHAAVSATPDLQRVDLAAGAERQVSVHLTADVPGVLLALELDCRCLAPLITTPVSFSANQRLEIPLRVLGVQTGLKHLTLRTTVGSTQVGVQVVVAGSGTGMDTLTALAKKLNEQGASHRSIPWFIVHNLRGELRNCGCSTGSLGGIDLLAALPSTWKNLAPQIPARFLLSGDADGHRLGVLPLLKSSGWEQDTTAVDQVADAAGALASPTPLLLIPPQGTALAHRRLIRPLMDRGAVATIVLIENGQPGEQIMLPIDRSLPSATGALTSLGETLTSTIKEVDLSASCIRCHATAGQAWERSAHHRRWTGLAEVDRVDGCVRCHSTPLPDNAITPAVHCQACHQGTDAHVAGLGKVKTAGAVDCRSCHDARHDPGFDRVRAWRGVDHKEK